MAEINLIGAQRKRVVERQAQATKVNKGVLWVAGSVLLVVAVVFGIKYWFESQLKQSEAEVAAAERQLSQLKPVADDSAVIARKLEQVALIVGQRETFNAKLDMFFSVFETGIDLRSAGFGGTGAADSLSLVGRVNNVAEYLDFDAEMVRLVEEKGFSVLQLESLSRGEDKEYRFGYLVSTTSSLGGGL